MSNPHHPHSPSRYASYLPLPLRASRLARHGLLGYAGLLAEAEVDEEALGLLSDQDLRVRGPGSSGINRARTGKGPWRSWGP